MSKLKIQRYISTKKWFSLVELIITITIISILTTIWFIYFQNLTGSARDSNRIANLYNIKTWLETFYIRTWKYPEPDNSIDILFSWFNNILFKQWEIWENIWIQINLSKTPKDNLTGNYYTYSTSKNWKYWQLATIVESNIVYKNPLIKTTYANNNKRAYVVWNYKEKLIKNSDWSIFFLPSIIIANLDKLNKVENTNEIPKNIHEQFYVVHNETNLPFKINKNITNLNTTSDNLKVTKNLVKILLEKEVADKDEIITSINNLLIWNYLENENDLIIKIFSDFMSQDNENTTIPEDDENTTIPEDDFFVIKGNNNEVGDYIFLEWWCKDESLSLEQKWKCILLVNWQYIAPYDTEVSRQHWNSTNCIWEACTYCNNLNINWISNWTLPLIWTTANNCSWNNTWLCLMRNNFNKIYWISNQRYWSSVSAWWWHWRTRRLDINNKTYLPWNNSLRIRCIATK